MVYTNSRHGVIVCTARGMTPCSVTDASTTSDQKTSKEAPTRLRMYNNLGGGIVDNMANAAQQNRTVQQLPMPPEVEQAIKALVANGTHETMGDLYDSAITWFWQSRAKKTFNFYLASNKRGKYKTLWIDSKILDRVRVIAARDDTSISRVIYTAIVLYLEDKGLF